MSRTYRRTGKRSVNAGKYHKGSRVGSWRECYPPCYRNARRQRCIASGSVKWWFHSRGAAIEAAKFNFKNRFERGKGKKFERAYHCRACGGYHLTSMNVDEWRDRKQEIADINGVELNDEGNFESLKPLTRYPDEV